MSNPKASHPKETGGYPSEGEPYPDEPRLASRMSLPGGSPEPPSRPSPRVHAGDRLPPELLVEIDRLAPSRVTVLIVGASAALRAGAARALHDRSARRTLPFVVFDCSGLSATAIEQDLFGGPLHTPSPRGAVQLAGSGTLHVAAIDELPRSIQPSFLRFLDDSHSVRVVASAADLMARVELGTFDVSLAERLMLVELLIP